MIIKKTRVLLLNSDYQPVDIITWKKCFIKLYAEKPSIYIINYYNEEGFIDGRGNIHPAPSVAVSKIYLDINSKNAPYTKMNVFARDNFTCQYCLQKFRISELTVDHINPKSKILEKTKSNMYKNITTSCRPCNTYKADNLLGKARYPSSPKEKWLKKIGGQLIVLHAPPTIPLRSSIFKKKINYFNIPDEWREYL